MKCKMVAKVYAVLVWICFYSETVADNYKTKDVLKVIQLLTGEKSLTSKGLTKVSHDAFDYEEDNNIDIFFSTIKIKGEKGIPLTESNLKTDLYRMAKDICSGKFGKKFKERACPDDYVGNAETYLADRLLAYKGPKANTSQTVAVDKLSDTATYTGSHKERFDESGKGKGAAGRQDKEKDTEYVGQYKDVEKDKSIQ